MNTLWSQAASNRSAPRQTQPRFAAIAPAALLIGVGFMSSTLVTPLYALYRGRFHFSEITLTLIYSVYVVGNLVALLFCGRVSDRIGRVRVGVPALILALCSTLLYVLASGTVWLFAARLVSGFAVGLSSGTGTAWLADLYGKSGQSRATVAATSANLAGAAAGPLLAGLLAQYAPAPLQLPFFVYAAMLVVTAFIVARARESVEQPAIDLKDVSFARIGVPRDAQGKFIPPAVAGFCSFALAGFYFALLPGALSRDLGNTSIATAGAVVFEMIAIAALVTLFFRELKSDKAMLSGLLMLVPSVVILVLAQAVKSMPLLLGGSAVTGAALGLGYRGSLEVVNELAPQDKRAAVVSAYFCAIFVGNSIPIIGIGVLSVLTSPLTANTVFASTIGAFAISAAAIGLRYFKAGKEKQ